MKAAPIWSLTLAWIVLVAFSWAAAVLAAAATNFSTWSDEIPPEVSTKLALYLGTLMYQVDSNQTTAVFEQCSLTSDMKLLDYIPSDLGIEAAILYFNSTRTMHVAFRGTDGSVQDFFQDILFFQLNFVLPGSSRSLGGVHAGFLLRFQGIYSQIDAALQKAIAANPETELIEFNGHSLGGADALLFGVYAASTFLADRKVRVLTFGTPRVGNSEFEHNVEAIENLSVWRVVYEDDAIPRLPPVNFNYQSVGRLLFLHNKTIRAYREQPGEDGFGLGDWEEEFNILSVLPRLFAHFPWNYQRAMEYVFRMGLYPTTYSNISDFVNDDDSACCVDDDDDDSASGVDDDTDDFVNDDDSASGVDDDQ